MKSNKTISIMCVLAFSLILFQNSIAQNKNTESSAQLLTQKTEDIIISTLLGAGGEVMSDGEQRFLVTVDRSIFGIMKESSGKEVNGY